MKKIFYLGAIAVSCFFISCNGGGNKQNENTESKPTTAAPGENNAVSNNVDLTANDQLKFSTNEIHVKANEKVTLTLKNIGTMPKESMAHNFILLPDGTDLASFAKEALNAPDHIPSDPNIIAHTKLLGPGESDTIEFTVPAGTYTYICSFPGHYMSMTGVLIAE